MIYRATSTDGIEGFAILDAIIFPIVLFLLLGMRAYLEEAISLFSIRNDAYILAREALSQKPPE